MNFVAQMFCESGSGRPSSMRAMSALVCVTIVGVWAAVSVERRELQPLSPEQTMLVLGALGVKAWQRGKEGTNGTGDTQIITK